MECRYANYERMSAQRRTCLKLASETKELYAKIALLELAQEFRAIAERSEPARVVNQN